eukprot:CAMPEP_0202706828 /NCGR_PEP_ID=MMETSP1385-20130828/19202_1 /ASSEMBLY_ACC=CAM_ASM_000861 /TAXON_ID=933848 /ORGANISM="Elphidium margaritaceum" /LENGTH=102 /DNA_ID=CAMNT_0049365381 /DNA_START=239 /DNA_END=544 /DNA_ORIENTATION=+
MTQKFTLKYDVMGIAHDKNNAICVAFCPWSEHLFAAGYENGMVCLFNMNDSNPIRRLYDPSKALPVVSVAWIKSGNNHMIIHALFNDGTIRFLDLNISQQSQ